MELNIPNPDTHYLSDAFGITPERVEELDRAHEALWLSYGPDGATCRWQHVIAEIAHLCNTTEELAYILVIHCAWLQRLGRKIA